MRTLLAVGKRPTKLYRAGLVRTYRGYAWDVVRNVDAMSTDIYEFEKVRAPSVKAVVKGLNEMYQQKYRGKILKTPFR